MSHRISRLSPAVFITVACAILSLLFSFSLLSIFSLDAKGEIVWLEKEYDFGLMKEENGPATGEARFVNRGSDPVVITGARPSCGCTGVEYSELPVAPGDTATIRFTYDPDGRPGKFEKSIKVYIGENDTYRIKISGNVLGTSESLSLFYPYESGPLRLSELILNAGELAKGATRSLYLKCYNQSLDSITPKVMKKSDAIVVKSSEPRMGPGDVAAFAIFFDSSKVDEVGVTEIPFTIISDCRKADSPEMELKLTAKVTPDFSALSPEAVDKAPRCYLIPDRIDLGIISGDEPKTISCIIQNQGKSKMDILRIAPQNESVRLKKMPKQIKPGKSAEALLSLFPASLPAGVFNLPVEVYSNDPLHPVRLLHLVGQKE